MKVIGIAGGVASGKSFVTEGLKQLGAKTIDADVVAHEVLREPAVKKKLHERWGDDVLDDDGEINRSAVARIVFAPTAKAADELTFLEQTVHPRIGERLNQQVEELRATETQAVVLDAAVMFKAGWDRFCDIIVFVDATDEKRLERAVQRGWTQEQFESREEAQEMLETKRSRADVVIDNSDSVENTTRQLREFWKQMTWMNDE